MTALILGLGLLAPTGLLFPQALAGLPPAVVPGGQWRTVSARELGFDEPKLRAGLAGLTGNVAVARRGYLCEVSRGDISAPLKLYSVGKSITALVFGALLQDGRLSLDTLLDDSDFPAPPKASYRQFMSMTSDYGLTPHEPGRHYAYNNEAVHFYGRYMDKAFFDSIGPVAVLQKVFWDVIGRQDDVSFAGYWSGWDGGFVMSARDAARLGVLVQRRGEWNGKQILSPSFIGELFTHQIPGDATMSTSTGQAPRTSNRWNQQQFSPHLEKEYSFGFWIAHSAKLAPNDAIAADGRGGNYIIVVPKHELVIAVTNYQLQPSAPSAGQYVDAVLDALSGSSPAATSAGYQSETEARITAKLKK